LTYYDFYDKFRSNSILKETDMAFKEYDRKPSFLDMELQRAFGQGQSRTQQSLTEIDKIINWRSIEKIVTENYPVGQSEYGNKAYPPLLLLKASLIQKWFGIHSDPELEIQINDRLSFKAFIGLPFREPSPTIPSSAGSGNGLGKTPWRGYTMSFWSSSVPWVSPLNPAWP